VIPDKHTVKLPFPPELFQAALQGWYELEGRDLPWRTKPGEVADPYRVWLSEIMAQQTRVRAVIPYFLAFTERWPTVEALASAPKAQVMAAWAGLGYYARARSLYSCAKELARGGFPKNAAGWLELPGIGEYTAAAIAAIAFDEPIAAVDGNVDRVVSRLFVLKEPLPGVRKQIRAFAQALVPWKRPGDHVQAMMDLGATVCTLRQPYCTGCPVRSFCAGFAEGSPESYPVKGPKSAKPTRRGDGFVILKEEEGVPSVLLRTRPEKGLLGGMLEIPSTEWVPVEEEDSEPAVYPPSWRDAGTVLQTFTHFHLELRVLAALQEEVVDEAKGFGGQWIGVGELERAALPTIMKKAAGAGLEALGVPGPKASRRTSAARLVSRRPAKG
jgi:A/G-specific adenine glycosylase